MTEQAVQIATSGGVATLTLNRPEAKNSLSADLVNALGDGLQQAIDDNDTRVIVLTNVGNTFCAGADLKGGSSEHPRYTLVQLFELMQACPKPIVGKIDGHCMGGGVGLASACDISVVNDSVKLGFTEVRLGVAPAIISVVCLPKMRRADAMELFLSGEKISAARAVEVGLINQLASPEQLDERVKTLTDKLVQGGPEAMAASKNIVLTVPDQPQSDAFARMGKLSAELFQSDEAKEGIAAFRERRPAAWVPKTSS